MRKGTQTSQKISPLNDMNDRERQVMMITDMTDMLPTCCSHKTTQTK